MTRRRLTITVDPGACSAGLAALEELARAGRTDVAEAIAVLGQIIAKPAPREAREPFVKVHMVRDWTMHDLWAATRCGAHGGSDVYVGDQDLTAGVVEVDTELCNIIEVTADLELVTCLRCRRGAGSQGAEGAGGRQKG